MTGRLPLLRRRRARAPCRSPSRRSGRPRWSAGDALEPVKMFDSGASGVNTCGNCGASGVFISRELMDGQGAQHYKSRYRAVDTYPSRTQALEPAGGIFCTVRKVEQIFNAKMVKAAC